MEVSTFWLLSIEESFVNVSLLSVVDGKYTVLSVGPKSQWPDDNQDSLIAAVDESLSAAATKANISEEEEPNQVAFVLPPFWVGSDGKITASKLKLIETLCRSLSVKPIGFIANDEAIVEDTNQADGFPASFILFNLGQNDFTLSLVYLGRVKERIKRSFEGAFNPQFLESALLELKSESALPPQIIVFGCVDNSILSQVKNFAWVGKKDVETFLHFPDVACYELEKLVDVYSRIIVSQINPQPITKSLKEKEPVVVTDEYETDENEDVDEDTEKIEPKPEVKSFSEIEPEKEMIEVNPEDLGFIVSPSEPVIETIPLIKSDNLTFDIPSKPEAEVNHIVEPLSVPKKTSLKLPKINFRFNFPKRIKLPKLRLGPFGFIVLAVSPLLILFPFFFSKARITLFVAPYVFNKQIPVTLDSTIDELNTSKSLIPVTKKVLQVDTEASVKTTGKKTIGEKAKGQAVVFNKLDKSQNLPKGTILIDPNGRQYTLDTAVSVASSSSNLELGVINLGQTKVMVTAGDIGSEFNINKDTKLKFKDYPETNLVARVDTNLNGGTKQEISAVSGEDKTALNQQIDQAISDSVTQQINSELSNVPGIIKETIRSKKEKVEFTREIGEEADELGATAQANVAVFVMDPDIREQVINGFLGDETDFKAADINPQTFNINFKVDKIDSDKATGVMVINGQALPKIDMPKFKKMLSGKTKTKAGSLIKKNINRVYNFNIKTNLQFLQMINPLPFRSENITIDVKTELL
jgi:hypothetical protein